MVNARRLWSLVICAAAICLVQWLVSAPDVLFADFRKAYHPAGRAMVEGTVALRPLIESASFTNLPVVAWVFAPLSLVQDPALAARIYLAIGLLGLVAAVWMLVRLTDGAVPTAVIVALFAVNGPLMYSLREGNTSHIALLLVVASMLLERSGRRVTAGVAIGCAAVLKLPLLLIILWLALRRRWHQFTGAAVSVCSTVLLSVVLFGPDLVRVWYVTCVVPFVQGSLLAFNVQSIDALFGRLVWGPAHLLNFSPVQRTPLLEGIRLVAILVATGMFFISARRPGSRESEQLSLMLLLPIALVMSPVSWSHYYCLLLIPWVLYLGDALPLPRDAVTRGLLAVSVAFASAPVPSVRYTFLRDPVLSRTVLSLTVIGGLVLIVALYRSLIRSRPSGVEESRAPR